MKFTAIASMLALAKAKDTSDDPKAFNLGIDNLTFFKDAKCTKAAYGDVAETSKEWVESLKTNVCTAFRADFVKVTCDPEGVTVSLYTDDKCTTLKKDGDGDEIVTLYRWGC